MVTVTKIPKRTNTDVRDSYVLFNIKANRNISNYHLAVKKEGEAKPTATEMIAGALKYNLNTNSINVLIAQHLDALMVAFVKKLQKDKNHSTLGAGMQTLASANGAITYAADNIATGDGAWVSRSVLEPSTEYTLYGMMVSSTEVIILDTFITDATAAQGSVAGTKTHSLVDSTLEKDHITITVNPDKNYYIFPLQIDLPNSSPAIINIVFLFNNINQLSATIDNNQLKIAVGTIPDNYFFFMTSNRQDSINKNIQKGMYIMMYPFSVWALSLTEITTRYNNNVIYDFNYSKLVK